MNEQEFIKKYCVNCKNNDKNNVCEIRRDINNNAACINYMKYDFITDIKFIRK